MAESMTFIPPKIDFLIASSTSLSVAVAGFPRYVPIPTLDSVRL